MKKIIGIIGVVILLISNPGFSQELILNENDKKEIVFKVASIVKEKYLFEEVGEKMSKQVLSQFQMGQYDSLHQVKAFCSQLTSDLRAINNDKHLFVFYSPDEACEVKAYKKLLPENEINQINKSIYEAERRENFGFKKIEILNGNIGYFKLDYFSSPDIFDEKLIGVMNFLSNTDAIIIDLRDNGGGEGSSLLSSYFLPKQEILLGSSCCRDTTQNTYSKTTLDIPGKRLTDIGLYILTSSNTFSAAEAFAYNMKSLNRAIIIGEKTKGGAHPIDVLIVTGDILMQIPICESYNPITKTNWEGVGVKPDIEASSETAFRKAHVIALKKLIENTTDNVFKEQLSSIIIELE